VHGLATCTKEQFRSSRPLYVTSPDPPLFCCFCLGEHLYPERQRRNAAPTAPYVRPVAPAWPATGRASDLVCQSPLWSGGYCLAMAIAGCGLAVPLLFMASIITILDVVMI
jgi:hypothetical protein